MLHVECAIGQKVHLHSCKEHVIAIPAEASANLSALMLSCRGPS